MLFHVLQASPEALLPLVGYRVPCPAGQALEAIFAVGIKKSFCVVEPLRADPRTERKAVLPVRLGYACVTVLLHVLPSG